MASKKYAVRDLSKCTKDCVCLYVCPTGASDTENGQVDKDKCIGCGACMEACPSKAISLLPRVYPKEQIHKNQCLTLLRELAERKVVQEQMLKGMNPDSEVKKQLVKAFEISNHIMAEDLLRESGFLIPQGVEAIKFLDKLYVEENDLDKATIKELILLLDPNHKFVSSTGTKKWRCMLCGYIYEGENPPENCPMCGAPAEMFELIE